MEMNDARIELTALLRSRFEGVEFEIQSSLSRGEQGIHVDWGEGPAVDEVGMVCRETVSGDVPLHLEHYETCPGCGDVTARRDAVGLDGGLGLVCNVCEQSFSSLVGKWQPVEETGDAGALTDLFQLRPRLPRAPALLELRLGFFQGSHPVGVHHRTADRHSSGTGVDRSGITSGYATGITTLN
jgi:hypothetical protein